MERTAEALLEEVNRLMDAERWQEAIDRMMNALSLVDKNRSLVWALGWAFLKLEKFETAQIYLQRAIALAPVDPVSRWGSGLALMEAGQLREAERQLLVSVALKDSYDGRLALACLYQRMNELQLAEAIHREGVRLRPDHRERLEALADFLDDVGRAEEAQAVNEKASALPSREVRRQKVK
jgi:Tfp pilus assembly protein PilF